MLVDCWCALFSFFFINVTSITRFGILWSSSGGYSLCMCLTVHFEVYTLHALELCGFRGWWLVYCRVPYLLMVLKHKATSPFKAIN
jgi:hypothetical protein